MVTWSWNRSKAGAVAIFAFLLASAGSSAKETRQGQKPLTRSAAPATGNPLTDSFGDFVRAKLDKWKVPGLSVAVVDGDSIYTQGYGWATLPDKEATAETLWYGASTTKAQVAAALAQLIDSRKYPVLAQGWKTPLSSIIRDDFVLEDEWATNHITLDDAVSHRTGLPRHDKALARERGGKQLTPRDVVRNLRNLPLLAEPRARFYYCNHMYVALSHVIETVTGSWLGLVLRDNIWAPLGMNSTFFDLDDALKSSRPMATGYYWDANAGRFQEVAPMTVVEASGAAAVISSAADYARWIKCLLHEAPPFSKAVHRDIKKPRSIDAAAPAGGVDVALYALGWQRTLYKGHVVYTHSGGMHAFGAQVYWLPEAQFGVAAFANTALTSNAVEDAIVYRLIEDKLGIPEEERFDFDRKWEKIIYNMTVEVTDADKILFPEQHKPPLPSTFEVEDLVGNYSDAGYGSFMLRQEMDPNKAGERILVADRDDMSWKYQMRIHHVSGDYWVVYTLTPWNPTFVSEYAAGMFRSGVDGRPLELEIYWIDRLENNFEGKTVFRKVP